MIEQIKNGFNSESINEAADQQNDTGLKNVLSGMNDGVYASQWNQLINDLNSKKGVPGTYTVMIKHDNKTDMVNLQYQIGADNKPVKGSTKLATVSTPATTGQNIDVNKIVTYEPNGKLYEFVAALITVAVEKFGVTWGTSHIKWVQDQVTICKKVLAAPTLPSYANAAYLTGTGNIYDTWINPLSDGDRPDSIDLIKTVIAGSATTDDQLRLIVNALTVKTNETVWGANDERAMMGLYMLVGKDKINSLNTIWKTSNSGSSPLGRFYLNIDDATDAIKQMFAQWLVGYHGLSKYFQFAEPTFYKKMKFDTASYTASLAAIKAALV